MRFAYYIIAIIVLLVGLAAVFPNTVSSGDAQMRILYLCVLLLFVSGGITLQHTNIKKNFKNMAIWGVIIAGLAFIYELLAKTG